MSSSPFILYWVQGFWGEIREIERDAHNTNKSFEKTDFILWLSKNNKEMTAHNVASNVGIKQGFGLLKVNKSSRSSNSSSLAYVSEIATIPRWFW